METDTVISLSSAVIALSALFLSMWQAMVTREHNKHTLTPHLTIASLYDQDNVRLIVDIENTGTGPAILKECTIKADGKKLEERPVDWVQVLDRFDFPGVVQGMTLGIDEFIQPGKSYLLLGLESFDKEITRDDIAKITARISINIRYESVYGESKTTWFGGYQDMTGNNDDLVAKTKKPII